MAYLRKSKRSISRLIVHHYGNVPPAGTNVETIRKMHVEGRGWDDIGYHGIIMPDGEFQIGRDVDIAGAHTWSFNRGSIGIMLVAGLAKGDTHTRPTAAQLQTLKAIISEQERYYPGLSVVGHRDLRPTLCPGFDVAHWRKTGIVRA